MKKLLLFVFICLIVGGLFSVFLVPSSAQAAGFTGQNEWNGLVPCGRTNGTPDEQKTCTLCHLIVGIYRIFTYGLFLILIVCVAAITIAGVMYIVSSGDEGMMTAAKSFIKSALIGFAVVAGSWLIVNTIMIFIARPTTSLGVGQVNWHQFDCTP